MRDMTKQPFEIQTPAGRKRSQRYLDWVDHGILRYRWHNFATVAPQVYRSNHPTTPRFEAYAAMGITTIFSLRGGMHLPQYLFEVFDRIEKPFLMHCKSGADRTGLAAALYLLVYEGAELAAAKKQLSFDFVHIRRTSSGILDHFLDTYEARFKETAITLRDWISVEYSAEALTASFAAKQKSLKLWQGWR